MSTSLLCRKKERFLAGKRTQWTISGDFWIFQDERAVFRGKSAISGCKSAEYSMGCCIAQVPFRQVGLLQIPLREVLDVHCLVQADGGGIIARFPSSSPGTPSGPFGRWMLAGLSVRSLAHAHTRAKTEFKIFFRFSERGQFSGKKAPISFREFSGNFPGAVVPGEVPIRVFPVFSGSSQTGRPLFEANFPAGTPFTEKRKKKSKISFLHT